MPAATKAIPVVTVQSIAQAQKLGTDGAANIVRPDTSAPPLTSIFILNVCSSTSCETISSGQLSTANTYTGPYVYTVVWEIGYGYGEIATQGGAQLSSSYLIEKDNVCISGGYYTISCPAGSSIVGFRYIWDNGYWLNLGYGNNFAAQDTSEVVPIRTYSTGIGIKYTR